MIELSMKIVSHKRGKKNVILKSTKEQASNP